MQLNISRVAQIALQAQTDAREPLCAYLYDLAALRCHVEYLMDSLPANCELFYAIKANSDLPILQTVAPIVNGFEVASGGELHWVRKHFKHIPVIFAGPGKTNTELNDALSYRVNRIHVESLGELERLGWLARTSGRTADVLLRMNIALDNISPTRLAMGGQATAFGIDANLLPQCLNWLRQHPEVQLQGFHFHLMSHQLDADIHLRLLAQYLERVCFWKNIHDLAIDEINVGGGIGVNYPAPDEQFDWSALSLGLAQLLASQSAGSFRIRFELGRYLSAACGYYVMEILDIKHSFGKTFIVARGGTHHFRTPYAQGHSHPFKILPVEHWPYPYPRRQAVQSKVSVVGQLCTPKDVLATDAYVSRARVGDLLLFPYAGAYAWHISHHDFLRHPHPQHFYLPCEETRHARA